MSTSTQVILLERVEKLGGLGDVVSVKPGYARNYLLPQKKALRASKQNLAYFETQRKHYEAENKKQMKQASESAKDIDGKTFALIRQASEAGQLYGSVTARDIAACVAEETKQTVERRMVQLNTNFKTIGLFDVDIMLHPEVKAVVTVNIARTPEEAAVQEQTGTALVADDRDDYDDATEAEALAEDAIEAEAETTSESDAPNDVAADSTEEETA